MKPAIGLLLGMTLGYPGVDLLISRGTITVGFAAADGYLQQHAALTLDVGS